MKTEPREPPDTDDPKKLQKWAGTKLSLSLAVTMYFKPPPEKCAEGVLKVYQRYLDLCEPQLTWFADETGKRFREARADVLRIPFDRVPQALELDKFYAWTGFAGKKHRHAAPYQFWAMLSPDEYKVGTLSTVRAAFAVDMFREDVGRFVQTVQDMAALVPVFHGVAGYSFSPSIEYGQAQTDEPYLISAAAHFSGVEVENESSTRLCCGNAIKGVNWLTMLDDSLVKRLGGEGRLRKQLGDEITVHRMPWGVMIQAGPEPGLGVVNAGETLPLYRHVNQVVRPVRVAAHMDLGVLFDEALTRRWIGRFD